ncbi:hypothetical protein RhiirA1_405256, partial [Rhizophagus irregularis]
MSAMLGVVQSDNMITLYLFWELTSISSFLLIGYWYNRDKSRFGALKSMMITVAGGMMMLGGFVLLSLMGGTFSIRSIIEQAPLFATNDTFVIALVLILLGTRDIRKLGGLMSIMPVSFTVALIGSFSMAGLPPFNGFLSKEMFLTAMLSVTEFDLFNFSTWAPLFPIIAWVA